MRRLAALFLVLSTVHAGAEEPRTLEDLRTRLADPSPDARENLVRDLVNGEYRSLPAEDVLSVLEPMLRTPAVGLVKPVHQGLLLQQFGRYGPRARAVLPFLVKQIENREARDHTRTSAMWAAFRIGPDRPEVVDALSAATGEDRICLRAAELLGEIGPAAVSSRPALVRLLEHESSGVQDRAFVALGRLRDEPEQATATEEAHRTIREWRERTPGELSAAMLHLQTWEEKRERAQRAEEGIEHVRRWADSYPDADLAEKKIAESVAAAERTREEARLPAVRRIREALRAVAADTNDHRNRAAIRTLRMIGPGSDPAVVRTLLETLRGPNAGEAEKTLRELDGLDQRSVVLLVDELKHRLVEVREAAETRRILHWNHPIVLAEALARFGPRAAPAAPVLVEELHRLIGWRDPLGADRYRASAYLGTLGAIGAPDEEAIGATLAVLAHPPPPVTPGGIRWDAHFDLRVPALRTFAGTGLPEPGTQRTKVLGELLRGVSSEDPKIALAATESIGAIGPSLEDDEAAPIVRSLTTLVAVDDDGGERFADSGWSTNARVSVIEALASLGPRALPARRALDRIANRELPTTSFFDLDLHFRRTLILAARRAVDAITNERDAGGTRGAVPD